MTRKHELENSDDQFSLEILTKLQSYQKLVVFKLMSLCNLKSFKFVLVITWFRVQLTINLTSDN